MSLATFWFVVIAVLWAGFLVLEGFDFGVGMLRDYVGRDEVGRRLAIATIGPVWDGNEVWLIVAAAGMFAAFPAWYAAAFSGFYLAILVLLAALIARGVSFEFRGRRDSARWRAGWDTAMTVGSLIAPLVVGIVLADLLHGVPIGADQSYAGGIADLFSPYSVVGGLTVVLICLLHGATYLGVKTGGEARDRADRFARGIAPVTAGAAIGFTIWTALEAGGGFGGVVVAVAVAIAALVAVALAGRGRDRAAFAATATTMAATISSIFVGLQPRVMVSTLGPATDLTVRNTASSDYSLTVMTVVVGVIFPVVLVYQAWAYRVFRGRIDRADITAGAH